MEVDLRHFENLKVNAPESIGVLASQNLDGSLSLRPTIASLTNDQLESRWGQVLSSEDKGVLRVENTIVLLDKNKRKAIDEVFKNKHIPKEQVKKFIESPSAFLDASLIDLDVGFSARVTGIGELIHLSFGELDTEKNQWFSDDLSYGFDASKVIRNLASVIKCPEDLERFEKQFDAAEATNSKLVSFDDQVIDVSDSIAIQEQIESLHNSFESNESAGFSEQKVSNVAGFGKPKHLTLLLEESQENNQRLLESAKTIKNNVHTVNWSITQRKPFKHQELGVEWAVDLITKAINPVGITNEKIQGALLADDMGLGKTYMSLIAIAEYYRLLSSLNKTCKPILVVAPLSLLENWKDEVAHTFINSPFLDIKILQPGKDLKDFRVEGVQRESAQLQETLANNEDFDGKIKYALKIGSNAGIDRLDLPKRLVLTSYDTLRSYQFSLCKVDWGLVFFDEAQNIKNPNTIQTRAAKALKADFKMLVTGTPVENSLADYWCLLDTAQPDLLGDWKVFRENWVSPIVNAIPEERHDIRLEVGARLHQATGNFMLRRTKEEELTGLPRKKFYIGKLLQESASNIELMPSIGLTMKGEQLKVYDQTLKNYQQGLDADDSKNSALTTLAALRNITLHPNLNGASFNSEGVVGNAKAFMDASAKLLALNSILEIIKTKQEKVIVFLINKKMQLLLKQALDEIYKLNIDIVNGDTKAVADKKNDSMTRKGIIQKFEKKEGFNIIIMSPIAAGVGLTIVGANHVVHLERHWNPAKEAQATDRVYRIGQTKNVHIYYPFSLHATKPSFDEHLALLLDRKHLLKEAVISPEPVNEEEVISSLFS
ncbi:DEAD/DEAH box helicase [Marinospirillum insulare]|nr:DEAD/DEAH box helicase [Marinospirillum insulare]